MFKNVLSCTRKWFYLIYIIFTGKDCYFKFKTDFTITIVVVNLLSISGGIVLAWSSPVISVLLNVSRLDQNPLGRVVTESEASLIGSLNNVGGLAVPLLASYSMNKIGRKYTMILTGIPYLVSSLLFAFCTDIEWYYAARIIGGLSLGSTFIVIPVYTAEIAEKHIRGFLGAAMQVFITFGSVIAFSIGPYLSIMWSDIIYALIPVLFLILSFEIPESPYYLVKTNNLQEASNIVKRTTNSNDVETIQKDLEEIQLYIKLGSEGRIADLFTNKSNLIGLIGTCLLMAFQQLSGINPINYYAETLFMDSGTPIPPEICTIIFGVTQMAATMVTPFFVDSFGRKLFGILSSLIMAIPQLSLGVYLYLRENEKNLTGFDWVPVVCLVIFVIGFNLGFASIPYIYMSEIFPESVKYSATTLSSSFNASMAFLMTLLFMPMSNAMSMSGVFFFYSAFNILAILFVALFIPETKGKSLQEIQVMLQKQFVTSRKW